jgi:hypothetical protein
LTLEKGDDAKDLRRALKAAATLLNRRIRFPFRGEGALLSCYLEGRRGRRRGRRLKGSGSAGEDAKAEARAAEEGNQLEAMSSIYM